MTSVVQFDRYQRDAQQVLDIAKAKNPQEVLIISKTDGGVNIIASGGIDRLQMMGALLAAAIDRWDAE